MSNYSTLQHIADHCDAIDKFLKDFNCHDAETFLEIRVLRDAVVMNILAIGELTTHLSDEFRTATQDKVDWKGLKQVRNIIAHRYGTVQYGVIWNIINYSLPIIKDFCVQMIEEIAHSEGFDEDQADEFDLEL